MISFNKILLVVPLLVQLSASLDETVPEVKTDYGVFMGKVKEDYLAFEGIPYVKAPIDGLRFKPPVYAVKTSEKIVANEIKSKCIQTNPLTKVLEGNEDCLYMNIYKPKTESKKLLPVIFHIYGGGFAAGSATKYGEKILMKSKNFIYVSFNYRLGILGFLSSGDDFISGNMGFKDQAMALRFVRENIEAFGGDPENIIVTGFSAGAASAHLFYMSPLTKNKFAAGISHSGTALDHWVYSKNTTEHYNKVLIDVECKKETKEEILKCLLAVPAEKFVKVFKTFKKFSIFPVVPFGLVVEPVSDHAFITELPLSYIKKGDIMKKPWIVSITKDDGAIFSVPFAIDPKLIDEFKQNGDEIGPLVFDYDYFESKETKASISKTMKEHCKELTGTELEKLAKLFTDRYYKEGLTMSLYHQASLMPMYMYEFDFKSKFGFCELFLKDANVTAGTNICHGDDMQYIYNFPLRENEPFTKTEESMSDMFISMYESFAIDKIPKLKPSYDFPKEAFDSAKTIQYVQIFSPEDTKTKSELYSVFGEFSFWNSTITNEPFYAVQ